MVREASLYGLFLIDERYSVRSSRACNRLLIVPARWVSDLRSHLCFEPTAHHDTFFTPLCYMPSYFSFVASLFRERLTLVCRNLFHALTHRMALILFYYARSWSLCLSVTTRHVISSQSSSVIIPSRSRHGTSQSFVF